MSTNKKSKSRLLVLVGYLCLIVSLLACAVVGGGAQLSEDESLRVDDGVIEVQGENGDWVTVAGNATFELVGELESTDPWTVTGTTFETNELTQIEADLQAGDLVRVRGTVLEDDTWVAYSIETTEETTDPIIILISIVESVDPWVVNGIELNVTTETEIQDEITEGMIVRVEILLLNDGTWEVLSIAPLGELSETSGCATVVATIVSVNGDEVQFLGWPTSVKLEISEGENDQGEDEDGEDEQEDTITVTLSADQVVLAVVCVSEDDQLFIVKITILNQNNDEGETPSSGEEKVLICHKPNKNAHTLSLPQSAIPAHLAHGDILGPCP